MDGTPYLRKEPKRYICDRMFGGVLHRKRTALVRDPTCSSVVAQKPPKLPPSTLTYGSPVPASYSLPMIDLVNYTPRKVGFGPNRIVTFFADSRLSDEEACEQFFTYLLDRSCITRASVVGYIP